MKPVEDFTEDETDAALIGILDGLVSRMEQREPQGFVEMREFMEEWISTPTHLLAMGIFMREGIIRERIYDGLPERLGAIHGAIVASEMGLCCRGDLREACRKLGELTDELKDRLPGACKLP